MGQHCQLSDKKSKTAKRAANKQPEKQAKRAPKKRGGKAFDALASRIVTMRESTNA